MKLRFFTLTLVFVTMNALGCGQIDSFTSKLKPKKTSRPCFDHEECFAGEYCAKGICAPYTGTTSTSPVNQADLGAYIYDLGQSKDLGQDADMQ